MKWKNWPILGIGAVLVACLLLLAHRFEHIPVLTYYLEDVAGGITVVVLSVATYDEWERRRERKRYAKPESMGVKRIQQEVFQLLYQYAFVLSMRWDPDSKEMQIVEDAMGDGEFDKSHTELHAKAAKHISQETDTKSRDLFRIATSALEAPKLTKQSYADMNDLILQTERTIQQLDMAIATYGYSFTPETHQWGLKLREQLSQAITGKIPILGIRLKAASSHGDECIKQSDADGLTQLIPALLSVGKNAQNTP
jgi:hypothetical protein